MEQRVDTRLEEICPEEHLDVLDTVRSLTKKHKCPMNCGCPAKNMEARAGADNFMHLFKKGILVQSILGDGDCSILGEIRNGLIQYGFDAEAAESLLPEVKSCINHKLKNMR
jgi:hypothetical protein